MSLACLHFLGLFLGLIVPGSLYYRIGTFSDDDVITYLKRRDLSSDLELQNVLEKVVKFNNETTKIGRMIELLESNLAQEAYHLNVTGATDLLKSRNELKAYLDSRRPPFHLEGFYPDPTIVMWSILYISFFWLICIFAPQLNYGSRLLSHFSLSYVSLFVGLELLFRWPTWLRNAGFYAPVALYILRPILM
jgi:hypothetical protein